MDQRRVMSKYDIRNITQSKPIKIDFIAEWSQWNHQFHMITINKWRNLVFEHNFVVKYTDSLNNLEKKSNNTYFAFPIGKG